VSSSTDWTAHISSVVPKERNEFLDKWEGGRGGGGAFGLVTFFPALFQNIVFRVHNDVADTDNNESERTKNGLSINRKM